MLERAGIVVPAPEVATDGRTSWWRLQQDSVTWSVDDFADAAERMQAKAAQRLNVDHHLAKLCGMDAGVRAGGPRLAARGVQLRRPRDGEPAELAARLQALRVGRRASGGTASTATTARAAPGVRLRLRLPDAPVSSTTTGR